jgi:excisionase family DNA binding protein
VAMERVLTPEQVADRLQISRLTVMEYLREGKIKAYKVGRLWRVTEDDLRSFFEHGRVQSVEVAPEEVNPPAMEGGIDWQRYDALKARGLSRRAIAREMRIAETTLRRLENRR